MQHGPATVSGQFGAGNITDQIGRKNQNQHESRSFGPAESLGGYPLDSTAYFGNGHRRWFGVGFSNRSAAIVAAGPGGDYQRNSLGGDGLLFCLADSVQATGGKAGCVVDTVGIRISVGHAHWVAGSQRRGSEHIEILARAKHSFHTIDWWMKIGG